MCHVSDNSHVPSTGEQVFPQPVSAASVNTVTYNVTRRRRDKRPRVLAGLPEQDVILETSRDWRTVSAGGAYAAVPEEALDELWP